MRPYKIIVDAKRLKTYGTNTIEGKQGDKDSRVVSAIITDDGVPLDLTGKTVTFYAIKPDETKIFNSTTIKKASDGEIEFNLTTQVLAIEGTVKGELVVFGADGYKLTSALFVIEVIKSINDESAIESQNEFTLLIDAMTKLTTWDNRLETKYNGLEQEYATELTTVKSQLAETSQEIKDIASVNIRDFGALPTTEDVNFDNTNALNNAIESMSDGEVLLFPSIGSKWRIDGTILVDKPIRIIGNSATIEYYGTGTAIKFGKDTVHLPSSNKHGVYLEGSGLAVINKSADVTNTIGVEYCNVIQSILDNFTVKGFGINWMMVGRNSCGCSQNTFNNLRLFDGGTNLKFNCELNGWVTENTWNKGQNTASSSEKISLDISVTDKFKPNSNQFNFINFENIKSTTVINVDNANNNSFNQCRFEGFLAGAIKLGVNSENNVFLGGVGNSGKTHASFSDSGRNLYIPNFGQTGFVGASANGGIVTGENVAETSNQGFPVFYTQNKTNPKAQGFKMGHNAMVGFRPDRQDYPFYYLDAETGKMYLTSGYFPKEEQPYLGSPSKAYMQIKNDGYTDIGFKIGDATKPAFLILGDYYIWVDSLGKVRIHTQRPTNLDTNGTVIGAQT